MGQLSNGDYIFQQEDGARSHLSKVTLAYLKKHCCKSSKPDFWLPNSLDLNPCDYAIWGTLEGKILQHNRFQVTTLEDLKQQFVEEWDILPQESTQLESAFAWPYIMVGIQRNIFKWTSKIFIHLNY